MRMRGFVAPRVQRALQAATRCALPFRLGGQPVAVSRDATQPFAVFDGLEPAHGGDRTFGMIEVRMIPEGRRGVTREFEEKPIVPVAHRKYTEQEIVDRHPMRRPLLIAAPIASHHKLTAWNPDQGRFYDWFRQTILTPGC